MDFLETSPNSTGRSFTQLEIWKKIRKTKLVLERIANGFPAQEKYRLVDQIVRSIRSANANIAEGHGRYTFPDQIHFCIQARGSLSETLNHCIDAYDSNYITLELLKELKEHIAECERILNGYINWLRKQFKKR